MHYLSALLESSIDLAMLVHVPGIMYKICCCARTSHILRFRCCQGWIGENNSLKTKSIMTCRLQKAENYKSQSKYLKKNILMITRCIYETVSCNISLHVF